MWTTRLPERLETKACLTRTAEVNMRKTITAIAVVASLLLTGCGIRAGSIFNTGEPYDSDFKDAEEFAEYWCGRCKEVDSYQVNDITVHEMKDDEWDFTISTDLTSVFKVTRAFGNIMKKNNYGRIINIASMYGLVGNEEIPTIAYHASKGGVINFTRAAAAELAK